jgi:hypothetical protein
MLLTRCFFLTYGIEVIRAVVIPKVRQEALVQQNGKERWVHGIVRDRDWFNALFGAGHVSLDAPHAAIIYANANFLRHFLLPSRRQSG